MTHASHKIVGIVQARIGSKRLPGKVLLDIGGRPVIHHVLSRVAAARSLAEFWLACSDSPADDALAAYAEKHGFRVWRGQEEDVLDRFATLARRVQADAVARVTGDCPMIDPGVLDAVVSRYRTSAADFVSNTQQRSFPDGLDVEVFTRDALERADREARDPFLRAHVTPYIHGRLRDRLPWGGFTIDQYVQDADFSHLRWTLDEMEDLEFFRRVVPRLPEGYSWLDALALLTREPRLMRINSGRKPYEGTRRDLARYGHDGNEPRRYAKSMEWFERATKTIPLGSQTFSKSHQQWVFGAAPLFMNAGRGCRVRDVDGNEYIDYVLGLLPIVLGYGDPDVDAAIEAQLDEGITFSMPNPKEAELAERLAKLIPCAEMVRFGKNGSDATTAAIRLARAYTGRDKIAIAGYHGWHDWYIGTTTRSLGVPAAVRALSATFPYNDADALAAMLEREPNAYAAVILEPTGAAQPAPGFLERLREVTAKFGVLLVFDEVITGFRIDLGGAQKRYGVIPDLASFGKSMGNGMPISAIVGRAEIMKLMEQIFFSTTFGGEALSLSASLATLDKLERENVVPRLWRRGAALMGSTNALFERHGFGQTLQFVGEGWWPRLKIASPPVDQNLLISLLRQEFNRNGLFLGASFNLCLAHDSDAIADETLAAADRSLAAVRQALDSRDPREHLRGREVRPVFSVR